MLVRQAIIRRGVGQGRAEDYRYGTGKNKLCDEPVGGDNAPF